jgi:hypothetical protein
MKIIDMKELIEFLTSGQKEHPLIKPLTFWCTESPAFQTFASTYRTKIRKNIRTKKGEDLRDYQSELVVAYLLVSSHDDVLLEYEKYGTGISGPDFTVTLSQKLPIDQKFTFNIEVKRLRERETAKVFDDAVNKIRSAIASILPYEVRFGFVAKSWQLLDVSSSLDLVDRFVNEQEAIILHIKQIIGTEAQHIPLHTRKEYFFPGFEKDRFGFFLLKISHEHLPDKPLNVASHLPNLWHSKASFKMGDLIIQKELAQMREGEVNILFVLTDSSVIEPAIFQRTLNALYEKVCEGDDAHFQRSDRGYEGTDDFLEKFKKVSGIILRHSTRYFLEWDEMSSKPFDEWTRTPDHFIWCNPQSERQIPQDIGSYLQAVAQKKEVGFF